MIKRGLDALTKRQIEYLELMADGLTNKEIAQQLFVAEGTVRTHTTEIFSRLHVSTRTAAARFVWEKRVEEARGNQ